MRIGNACWGLRTSKFISTKMCIFTTPFIHIFVYFFGVALREGKCTKAAQHRNGYS